MNQNETVRRAKAYAHFVKATERIPIGAEVAKAVHLDWADNISYEEVSALTLPQFQELLDGDFSEKASKQEAAVLLQEFQKYIATKEGRPLSKKTKSLSKRRQVSKTRRNTKRKAYSA
jgi:uncharacterized protein YdaT